MTVNGSSGGQLAGITVNMRDISDAVPTLAAIPPFADGPVRIEDVYNTRVKERNRLEACAENLRTPGITLDDPGCVKKTFPGFLHALAALRTAWQLDL